MLNVQSIIRSGWNKGNRLSSDSTSCLNQIVVLHEGAVWEPFLNQIGMHLQFQYPAWTTLCPLQARDARHQVKTGFLVQAQRFFSHVI
jgi:hypothetical protein